MMCRPIPISRTAFILFTLCLMNVPAAYAAAGASEGTSAEASQQDDAYLLRYRFRAGTSLHYKVTHQSTITMVKGPIKGVARNGSTARKHLKVVAVDDKGNAVLEPVIDSVNMWVQFDDTPKKSYNSETDDEPIPQFAGVAKTIGKTLVRLKVAPNGELLEAVPQLDKNTQKKVTKNNGPPTASNDASKNFLIVFPEESVSVGDSWTDSDLTVKLLVQSVPRLYRDYTILRKYKLVSVKDGKATIQLSMTPKQPVNDPRLKTQLIQRLLSGTIVFDINRGEIVSRRMTVDNSVIGFAQNKSRLHVKSERREQLIRATDVAAGQGPTQSQ